MKKLLLTLALGALTTAGAANGAVIINEVYAGGGSGTGSPSYTRDFVELYNTGALPVSLAGFSLQYASAANSFTNTIVNFAAGSIIGPGDYLTVVTGSAGAAGATLPATNANFFAPTGSSASLSNTAGAVRLFDGTAAVDIVGFGAVTSPGGGAGDIKIETAAAPAPSNTASSLNRTGFVDNNNNSTDFTNAAPTPTLGLTSLVVVPEPTTLAALAGAALVGLRRRRA